MASIIFQIAHNKVLFGNGLEVDVRLVGTEGQLQVNGQNGPTLRPLSFGERNRLVRMVALSSNIPSELATVMSEAATTDTGSTPVDAAIVSALALHFAGAGTKAPGFSTQVGILSSQFGWTPSQIEQQPALEADDLTAKWVESNEPETPDDGWNRLIFNPAASPSSKAKQSVEDIVSELANDLLTRYHAQLDRTIFTQPARREKLQPVQKPASGQETSRFSKPNPQPASPQDQLNPNESRWSVNHGLDKDYPRMSAEPVSSPATPELVRDTTKASNTPEASVSNENDLAEENSPGGSRKNESSPALPQQDRKESSGIPESETALPLSQDLKKAARSPANKATSFPAPATAESNESEWDALGLNNPSPISQIKERPDFNPAHSGSQISWQTEKKVSRQTASHATNPVQASATRSIFSAATQEATQRTTAETSSAISPEAIAGSVKARRIGADPFHQQDVVQAVADALNRMADLRGIDP